MASTYLTRTPSSAGNRKTWTWSAWIKKSTIAVAPAVTLFGAKDGGYPEILYFASDDTLVWQHDIAGSDYLLTISNKVFRDTNAWYHIVLTKDTTQSTETNRVKIYINGEQQTLTESQLGFPGQNYEGAVNNNVTHTIGNWQGNSYYFNGSMSHIHFIDGTAYDASAFGEYDANGVWKIKTSPSVTYGTNGFFILKNGNSVTDQSGNSNNFTVGGGTLTNTEDNPSNVFATMNPLGSGAVTFAEGNLQVSKSSTGWLNAISGFGVSSGKWYAELKVNSVGTNGLNMGYINLDKSNLQNLTVSPGEDAFSAGLYSNGGVIFYASGATFATVGSPIATDIMQFAMDIDNGFLYWGKNGTWLNSGVPTSGATGTGGLALSNLSSGGTYTLALACRGGGNVSYNFGNGYFGTTAVSSAGTNASGNGIFEYDVPTGYTALSTKGLNL